MVLILLRLHLYLHVKESLFLQPFFQQELAQAMKTLGTSGDARLETVLEEEILLGHLPSSPALLSSNKSRT